VQLSWESAESSRRSPIGATTGAGAADAGDASGREEYEGAGAGSVEPAESAGPAGPDEPAAPAETAADDGYRSPAVLGLGPVWRVTRGSSSSGSADANSHYYW
jgi:hypothetical protein